MRRWAAGGAVVAMLAIGWSAVAKKGQTPAPAPADTNRERAYRSNNLGVALLEQFNYEAAAAAFREALRLDTSVALARLNFAIALLYLPDLDGALREASAAAQLMPSAPQPPYLLGLIAREQNRDDDAQKLFARVRQIDPGDPGAAINLAQIALQNRQFDQAVALLGPVVAQEPYNVTATYNLGLALSRAGRADEGRAMMEKSQVVRAGGYGTTLGNSYLEQGRYAEAIASTGAEPGLVDPTTPPARFTATAIASDGARQSGLTLVDVDRNGSIDVVSVSADGQRLFLNDGRGSFSDATASSGLAGAPARSMGVGAISGDVDNDGLPDIFVVRQGTSSLYHNEGGGRFADVTERSRLAPYPLSPGAAGLVDVDHDGDLDLLIGGLTDTPAPLQLQRNNGDGTFTDMTHAAGLTALVRAIAIVPTDFDNRRDIDLLILNRGGPPLLLKNLRDGTFGDVARDTRLAAAAANWDGATAVSAGDVNKDDLPDFVIGRANDDALLVRSDGRGGFAAEAIAGTRDASSVQMFDYDNDGLLDIASWSASGLHIIRNAGDRWVEVTTTATGADRPASPHLVAVGDIDGDGTRDLVVGRPSGAITAWRGAAGTNAFLRVGLRGRVSNRSAVGSKVQMRAGSLIARLETSSATPAVSPADVVFGLGRRIGADVVRVLWPSGVLQAEYAAPPPTTGKPAPPPIAPTPIVRELALEELDRKPSSCPFLFTWNGERFEFVTDFMGGGELGAWHLPGEGAPPDPVEYVRIRGDQLRADHGTYHVRVTNELEETLFVDRVQLLSIAHPSTVEIFPNEGMTFPPKPFKLHTLADARQVRRAADEHGHDVTARLARVDRQYPDDFQLNRIRGYGSDHTLTLDVGDAGGPVALALTAWTDYAFSSDNVAAHQAGLSLSSPSLDIQDAAGSWRTAIADIGIPVGRPQTLVADLSSLMKPGEHVVRIRTNMRIYWDQILVGRPMPPTASTRAVPVLSARLHERGFSEPLRPDGREPETYDYARVSTRSPWKVMAGRFTRPGDVRQLLSRTDDRFVISKPGDEVELAFDAKSESALPAGWTRTFLLVADGFSKEMDINSASPDTVEPLPFHGMKEYPRLFVPRLPRIERTR